MIGEGEILRRIFILRYDVLVRRSLAKIAEEAALALSRLRPVIAGR